MLTRRQFLAGAAVAGGAGLAPLGAATPKDPTVPPADFAALHKMIKPQKGEWLWATIPWELNFREAQKKAAEQGKPLVIVMAAQGSIAGCC